MNQRMKSAFPLGGIAISLVLLASCGSDREGADTPADGRVALEVTSGIQTRAANAEWAKGDAIGIYMQEDGGTAIAENATNRKYVAQVTGGNVAFLPEAGQTIYYPIDGSIVDFTAYYPHQALADEYYPVDVSEQADQPAIDLMTAVAEGHSKTNAAVAFKFVHLLTKLELVIEPGNGLTAADLAGIKVEITGQRTTGSYNLLYRAFGIDPTPESIITLNTKADGKSAEAILLPNDAINNAPVAGRELVFTLKGNGEVLRWSIPDDKSFLQGDKNLYTITVNRTSLGVTSSIKDWNKGDGGSGSAE